MPTARLNHILRQISIVVGTPICSKQRLQKAIFLNLFGKYEKKSLAGELGL
jgi:hypothetical protein